jgi:hypothetical protein
VRLRISDQQQSDDRSDAAHEQVARRNVAHRSSLTHRRVHVTVKVPLRPRVEADDNGEGAEAKNQAEDQHAFILPQEASPTRGSFRNPGPPDGAIRAFASRGCALTGEAR